MTTLILNNREVAELRKLQAMLQGINMGGGPVTQDQTAIMEKLAVYHETQLNGNGKPAEVVG